MAIKFQYNKISLQQLDKHLKMRERALPTLKNKETALRMEVKKAKDQAKELDNKLQQMIKEYDYTVRLWGEFDATLLSIEDVHLDIKKIAGVHTPLLKEVQFKISDFNMFTHPVWTYDGINLVKDLVKLSLEQEVFLRKMELLDFARKKTTQKVNLYEKVQIPGFQEAIRKIKRFLEDEENLSKSAQKIVKSRQQQTEVET